MMLTRVALCLIVMATVCFVLSLPWLLRHPAPLEPAIEINDITVSVIDIDGVKIGICAGTTASRLAEEIKMNFSDSAIDRLMPLTIDEVKNAYGAINRCRSFTAINYVYQQDLRYEYLADKFANFIKHQSESRYRYQVSGFELNKHKYIYITAGSSFYGEWNDEHGIEWAGRPLVKSPCDGGYYYFTVIYDIESDKLINWYPNGGA